MKTTSRKAATYRIDGENQVFSTLKDAKYHIYFAYTDNERIRHFGKEPCYIEGLDCNGDPVSITEIRVSESGKESFGRTMGLNV